MSKKVFELVIKLLCSKILLPFYHRMKVIRENFAQSNFFWTARQIECFCLLGFKALWLMVTFLAALKSVDILIFHRRSIFRSLIFGPDFPDFWTSRPHWMFHPFFKAWKGSSENEGIGRVCMGWSHLLGSGRSWHFISLTRQHQLLHWHFFHQAFRPGSSSVGISQKFLAQILSNPASQAPNLKISTLKWNTCLRSMWPTTSQDNMIGDKMKHVFEIIVTVTSQDCMIGDKL